MDCARCQLPLEADARWCSYCGEPVPAGQPLVQTQPMPYLPVEPAPPEVIYQASTSGAAIAALVFGIAGLVGPLYVIGPLLALGFARRARREISRSGGGLGGWEVARAARICAWTSLVLLIIGVVVLAGLVVWGYYATGPDVFDLRGQTPVPFG